MASIKIKGVKPTTPENRFRILFTSKCRVCSLEVNLAINEDDGAFEVLHIGKSPEECKGFNEALAQSSEGLEAFLHKLISPMPPEKFWRHVPRHIRGVGVH